MNNIFTISKFAVKELSSKKIVWFFFGISIFVLAVLLVVFNSFNIQEIAPVIKFKGRHKEVTDIFLIAAMFFKTAVAMPLFGGGLFISIFAVSGLIPSILEKGTVEFFLSRPVKRFELLLGEFLGGIFVIFLNISFLVLGTWLLVGIYLGDWSLSFLLIIPAITLVFSLFYSLIILMGVKWQNSVSAMMISYLIFIAVSPILNSKDTILVFLDGAFWRYLLNILYYIVPQSSDLAGITASIAFSQPIDSFLPLGVAVLQLSVYLYLAVLLLKRKDF
jgi:ABC-type transport system involved in multi-copper enzyme maturation permease subunit